MNPLASGLATVTSLMALVAPARAATSAASASAESAAAIVPARASSEPSPPASPRALGFTLDLLPIVLSATAGHVGLSAQVWAGFGHYRLRLVGARLALPDWLAAKDGFEDQTTLVLATIVDYVFGRHFDGLWLGAGFEYWHSSIGRDDVPGARVSWDALMATAGGGYTWPLIGNFYIEPWGAAHLRLTSAHPELGGVEYRVPRLNAELSLKLGVFFDL